MVDDGLCLKEELDFESYVITSYRAVPIWCNLPWIQYQCNIKHIIFNQNSNLLTIDVTFKAFWLSKFYKHRDSANCIGKFVDLTVTTNNNFKRVYVYNF